MALKEEDVTKMLVAATHLGSENVNFQMEQYIYKRRPDGVNIINLGKTWEKLMLAARAIAAIEHSQDVSISKTMYTLIKFLNDDFITNLSGLKFNEANLKSEIKNKNNIRTLSALNTNNSKLYSLLGFRHLVSSYWSTCCLEIRQVHRHYPNCWSFHSWCVYQSNSIGFP